MQMKALDSSTFLRGQKKKKKEKKKNFVSFRACVFLIAQAL